MKNEYTGAKEEHLPTYGVGPFYGAGIIILTVIGIILSCFGILDFAKFQITKIPFMVIGVFICLGGFLVWFKAAFRIDRYIEQNELCTDGIYGIVRNPCYSGIMLMCSGVLFLANNVLLLVLPPIFWFAMTILMKNTEEKWLYQLYGEPYREYCRRVNRCIPWFAKKGASM